MPRKSNALLQKVGRWEQISANLEPYLEDMPHVAELRAELDQITALVKQLVTEQKVHVAASQVKNRERLDLEVLGEKVRSRIAAALRSEHGFTSEKLVEFGLRPIRSRGRRPATAPPDPGPAPGPGEEEPDPGPVLE